MARKIIEEYTRKRLETNFDKTKYLTASEERPGRLEVDENTKSKETDEFNYLENIEQNEEHQWKTSNVDLNKSEFGLNS